MILGKALPSSLQSFLYCGGGWGVPPPLVENCTWLDSHPTKFLFSQPKVHLPPSMAVQFQYSKKCCFQLWKKFEWSKPLLVRFLPLIRKSFQIPHLPTRGFPLQLNVILETQYPLFKMGLGWKLSLEYFFQAQYLIWIFLNSTKTFYNIQLFLTCSCNLELIWKDTNIMENFEN